MGGDEGGGGEARLREGPVPGLQLTAALGSPLGFLSLLLLPFSAEAGLPLRKHVSMLLKI